MKYIEHGDYKEIHPVNDDDGLIIIADIDPENQMTDKQRRSIGKKLINGLNYIEWQITKKKDNFDCKLSPLCKCDDCREQLENETLPPDRI